MADEELYIIRADVTHGLPLDFIEDLMVAVSLPPDILDIDEQIYRVKSAPGFNPGDILIVEPRRGDAATGELVLAAIGERVYIGRYWAKHGQRVLRTEEGETVVGHLNILGAVNQIVRHQ